MSVAPSCRRLQRTRHGLTPKTRSARRTRQRHPPPRWSYCKHNGVSDNVRPFSRPKPCAIRYSRRYAATPWARLTAAAV